MKKRNVRGHGLSLLLCGMLLLGSPLQALASDEVPAPDQAQEIVAQEYTDAGENQEISTQEIANDTTAEAAAEQASGSAAEDTSKESAAVKEEQTSAASDTTQTSNHSAANKAETTTSNASASAAGQAADDTKQAQVSAYTGTQKLEAVTADGVQVQVSFTAGTFGEEEIPELKVKDVADAAAEKTAQKALPEQEIAGAKSVDISFYVDGTEVQPKDGQNVSVQIDLPESVNPDGEQGIYSLIHEHAGQASVVKSADVTDKEASFQTDSFSTFTITWTVREGYSNARRANLTVHYVDENGNDLSKPQSNISINNNTGSIDLEKFDNNYIVNTINNYRYYNAYILVNGEKKTVTDITYVRETAGRNYIYTINYLNDGQLVTQDLTNSTNGVINRDIYLEYHSILSGEHDASVYFLLTPTSDADSNDTSHWNDNAVAVGLNDAKVNLEGAVYTSNKNIFRDRNGNGDLSKFIVSWPDGSTGATWTIHKDNTNAQWQKITQDVAEKYQEQLQEQLGSTATIQASDIESITVTPYKISINNGNVPAGGGSTEVIHIDSTISVVAKTAYHYAFIVDYPDGSGYTDGTVKQGDKAIKVSATASTPDAITNGDKPAANAVPQMITDKNGIRYRFDGWYRSADYNGGRAEFDYQPTTQEIRDNNGTITFYARYVQDTKNIQVTKNWEDNNNQDGKRPTGVTICLLADGKITDKTITLAAGDHWTGTFTGLPIQNNDGSKINYTVQEVPVAGYTSSDPVGSVDTGFTITNTHTPETISIHGNKIWDDAKNQDGKRPNSVTIRLYADGDLVTTQPVSGASDADTWNYSFDNLPKYKDGELIHYTVTEDQVEGYTSSVNDDTFEITNTYTPSKTGVTVTKNWEDNNNQDGIRPNDITVKLLANGHDTGKTVTLSEGTSWSASFSDLDEYSNGQKINYTVEEAGSVNGYTAKVTGDAATGFVITNSHNPETINISGTKIWNDSSNQDGKRPSSITVRLRANGTVVQSLPVTDANKTNDNTWKYAFTNLPKYADGQPISYTVTEDAVDNYSSDVSGFTITNSYTPEKTSVMVTKEWDDNDNQDGIRPNDITVKLLANGKDTGKTVKLNAANQWNESFKDLDMYQNGQQIIYTVEEATSVKGYTNTISGNAQEGFKITNIHQPETITISGSKAWDDDNNRDGKRPESITVKLLNTDNEVVDAKDVSAGEDGQWTWKFTNVPKKANGQEINYTVEEDPVEGYTPAVTGSMKDGFTITNQYTPEKAVITVTKRWEDSENADGIRPEKITINLLANGDKTGQQLTLDEDNHWIGIFEVPKYQDGEKIEYTIEEEKVDGYETQISGDTDNGFVVVNSHNVEKKDPDPQNPEDPQDPGKTPQDPDETPGEPKQKQEAVIPQNKQNLKQTGASVSPAAAKAPKTGDTSDLARYGVLLLAGFAALATAIGARLKDRKKS